MRHRDHPDHVTTRGLTHLWAHLKGQATAVEWPLIRDVTFHDLRHDFPHRARAAGWSLEELGSYLGHQTKDGAIAIASTLRYTLPSRQHLKAQLRRLEG